MEDAVSSSAIRVVLIASILALSSAAYAASGGNGGGNGGGSSGGGSGAGSGSGGSGGSQVTTCKKGYVYSQTKKACVKKGVELIPDEQLYQQGRALALAGDYEAALELLSSVKRTDDAMVYTMLGFTTRKLGRWDEGMAIYRKALAIDPINPNTHEYIGEAYVTVGRIDLAQLQLAEVEKGCGNRDCYQYVKLSDAIRTGVVQ
jgi:hypothetical protein